LPGGRLILCEIDGKAAGCIALKPLEQGVCEMKRLFVRPEFRGRGLGPGLAGRIIEEARIIGYSVMRLDTIKGQMDNAIALYTRLGFTETSPYYNNPIPDAYYMELKL
jgi:ribosomal protein S18 acetylase RimI-like enzyme